MPDPRREPFPDETQIDPQSPNRRARERIEQGRRSGAQPVVAKRRDALAGQSARDKR
jgi:hypothetical protein